MQLSILSSVSLAVTAAQEDLATRKRAKLKELFPANQALTEEPAV